MFKVQLSSQYNIHRTRTGFQSPIDNFESMAEKGILIIDKVVEQMYLGEVRKNKWVFKKIPTRFSGDYVDDPPDVDLSKLDE